MSITLPGAHNMCGCFQNAISKTSKSLVYLNKEVHQALNDFCWIAYNLTTRSTRIGKLIPLDPSAEGHHDVSSLGAVGV